jgi:hypothetical protein
MDWLLGMLHHALFLLSRLSNNSQENMTFRPVPFNGVSSVLSTFRSYPMAQVPWDSSASMRIEFCHRWGSFWQENSRPDVTRAGLPKGPTARGTEF